MRFPLARSALRLFTTLSGCAPTRILVRLSGLTPLNPFWFVPMIEVKGLVKTYGPKRAVDGVTFSVKRGDILGFLGPSGAGKSTTMKMITGFLRPDAGTAK